MSSLVRQAPPKKVYTRADMRALLNVNDDELTDLIMTKKVPQSDYSFNNVGRWKSSTVQPLMHVLAARRTTANPRLGYAS